MYSLPLPAGISTPEIAERLQLAAVALDAEELLEFLRSIAAEPAEEAP